LRLLLTVCPDPRHKREKSARIDLCFLAGMKHARQKTAGTSADSGRKGHPINFQWTLKGREV
jgi:hypothetical protein